MFPFFRTKVGPRAITSPPEKGKFKSRRRFAVSAGLVIAGLGLFAIPTETAVGQSTFTWNVPTGFWDIGNSWNPSGPPGSSDIASFSQSMNATVSWDDITGNRETGRLEMNAGNYTFFNNGTAQWMLAINSDSATAFQVSGPFTVMTLQGLHINAVNGGGGIVQGATMNLDGSHPQGARLSLAKNLIVDGSLNILDGGRVSNFDANIGGLLGSNGAVKVSGAGSRWTNSNLLRLNGRSAENALDINAGGAVSSAVGEILGGKVTVTGEGSTWTNTGVLSLGTLAATADLVAVLEIKAAGLVSTGEGRIGWNDSTTGFTGTALVTGSGSRWISAGDLSVGTNGTGFLNVEANARVSNIHGHIGREAGSIGTATVKGAGSKWTNSGDLFVGTSGSGTLIVEDGAQVSNLHGHIGKEAGSVGVATVNGTGSSWTNTGDLFVGFDGSGKLDVENGGEASASRAFVGQRPDSSGSINVAGPGSKFDSQDIIIGFNGGGSLNIQSGGLVSTSSGSALGFGASATATVTGADSKWNTGEFVGIFGELSLTAGGQASSTKATIAPFNSRFFLVAVNGDGSKWTISEELAIGTAGIGILNVNSGGQVSSATGAIGGGGPDSPDTEGTVTVSGMGTKWSNSGGVSIGEARKGNLIIENGGQVSNTTGVIGNQFGSGSRTGLGKVTVTGADSKWTNSGNLTIGNAGVGTLNILDGGETFNKSGFIGQQTGSTGTVTVSGPNARWTNSETLLVGSFGTGNVTVANSGQVSSNFGFLGAQEAGIGTVTVTGVNSKWTNSGDLLVGFEGTGTLNVNNGGLVSVGGQTSINAVSQVNLNGGRFEFGTTDQTSFKRIHAVGGSLAGTLNVSGLNAASSFTALTSAADSSEVHLVNSGRLFGDGLMGARVTNLAAGEIRVSSGQFMSFEGVGNINAGEINNTGGRVEFNQGLTNQAGGFISGRGEFAANGGWTNNGVLAFSGGLADVYGDVANGTAGRIAIAGNSTTTFYDDVNMSAGNMNVQISQNGSAVFFGSYNGGSVGTGTVHTFGDLRPGNSPGIVSFGGDLILGDSSATLIELAGLSSGMFDQIVVSDDLFLGGTLNVALIDGFTLGHGQTFDVGLVNGSLFGAFASLSDGALVGNFGGVDLFIDYRSGGLSGNGFSLVTAIPEPSALTIFGLAGLGLVFRRRRTV